MRTGYQLCTAKSWMKQFICLRIFAKLTQLSVTLLLFIHSSPGQSAVVVYKGRSYVIIDAGSSQGLRATSAICINKLEDQNGWCGSAKIVRLNFAGIRFKAEDLKLINLGMQASSEDLIPLKHHPEPNQVELNKLISSLEKRDVKPPVAIPLGEPIKIEAPQPVAANPQTDLPIKFGLGLLFSPLLPFVFQVPNYDIDNELAEEGSLWNNAGKVSTSMLGLNFLVTWPQSLVLAIVFGLHYRAPQLIETVANYDGLDPNVTIKGDLVMRSFGGSIDASYHMLGGDRWAWNGRIGIDLDHSSISYKAKRGDTSDTIAALQSKLTIPSLRFGSDFYWTFGFGDLRFGFTTLLPIAAEAQEMSEAMELKPTVFGDQAAASQQDLSKTLGHRRSRFGILLDLGLTKSF